MNMNWKEFTQLVMPHKDKLYRFSLRFVGSEMEAEDVVQEVMIKLWNKRDELHKLDNIEAWCMRLTKNLSIDKMRSKHKRTNAIPDGYDMPAKQASPHRLMEVKDAVSRVHKLIEALPEKQKRVIQLRDIEQMTYDEISKALSIPVNHVKVTLYRARQKVKAQLLNVESYGL